MILDVVYNHTAEAGDFGPALSFRGIDNPTYYHLSRDCPRRNVDCTGTGNMLQVSHPVVLRLVMDSLRYWVEEMHVDGFRFDLASALARDEHGFSDRSAFFAAVHQDPVLSGVKLIAEPWDTGEGGYRMGGFPRGWSEWNDRHRDAVHSFCLGTHRCLGELGRRLSGSADLFQSSGRRPSASINFVTAHDGFTLADLVSHQSKHNQVKGEHNRDGCNHNLSNNFGVEGPTSDPEISAIRVRERKNMLATLMVSLGVPMIADGDELGRTQRGNNNAYNQDNETSWLDWELDREGEEFLAFTKQLIELRKRLPLRLTCHPTGAGHNGRVEADLAWFRPDGTEMQRNDRIDSPAPAFGFLLLSSSPGEGCFVVFNDGASPVAFALPPAPGVDDKAWRLQLSTDPAGFVNAMAPARSVSIFALESADAEG